MEWLKIYDLRKLGNFKTISEMLGIEDGYACGHPKGN